MVSKINTNFLLPNVEFARGIDIICIINATLIKEEMIPVSASLMPMLERSFAKNTSPTNNEIKYSKVHWAT